MKKYLASLLFVVGIANAGLVNGVAVAVNDEPITLYDIDKTMVEQKLNKNEALKVLIDKLLYEQVIKKESISVDIFDIDNYIGQLAAQNKLSTLEFKSIIRQQQDYDTFVSDIKKRLIHEKLIKKLARGNIKLASDKDIEIYYENNQKLFQMAQSFDVVAYVSKDKRVLINAMKNPMISNENLQVQEIALNNSELNPKVKFILNNTTVNKFSNIFAQNGNYNMFYVKNKKNITTLKLEDVKEKIFQTLMQQREKEYLEEYFETLKITANIKVYR